MKGKYLITLLGPTATGKTNTAILLAKEFKTEIISADSRQFYHEMNIGTAKPNSDQLAEVKHHCISFISVQDKFNAYDFEIYALQILDSLFSEKDIVIVAGGSGLYIDALINGIDPIPDIDPVIRNSLLIELKEKGLNHLLDKLEKLDPKTFYSIDKYNSRRIIRALEVCLETGKPYSSFLHRSKVERSFTTIKIGLTLPLPDLYNIINLRCDNMLTDGLLNEVKELYPLKDLSPLKTIGYTEFFDYLQGRLNVKEATELFKQHSRNYAKRQLSWFRRDKKISWFERNDYKNILQLINKIL